MGISFTCLHFAPWVREEFPPRGYGDVWAQDTRHWTGGMDRRLSVTSTHRLGRRKRTPHGATGVVLGNRANEQGLREADFVVPGGRGAPWFPCEDVIELCE